MSFMLERAAVGWPRVSYKLTHPAPQLGISRQRQRRGRQEATNSREGKAWQEEAGRLMENASPPAFWGR